MTVHHFDSPPSHALADALTAFERQFSYPLGESQSFHISHGEDYARFFRAIGRAACFVAERNGTVLATLGAVIRDLVLPDGSGHPVVYLGDLKAGPAARGGRSLPRLFQAAREWAGSAGSAAFGVVMDGTQAGPGNYTGRLGIPAAELLGEIMVLRLFDSQHHAGPDDVTEVTTAEGEACYRRLSAGCYASTGGNPTERSEIEPLWLMRADGSACGRLEDTFKAKRLITSDGLELRSAHLSRFAYRDAAAAAALLQAALFRAEQLGCPALFASVAQPDADSVIPALNGTKLTIAPAKIYGMGLKSGPLWNIDTAEI